jgi:hypothetical protein
LDELPSARREVERDNEGIGQTALVEAPVNVPGHDGVVTVVNDATDVDREPQADDLSACPLADRLPAPVLLELVVDQRTVGEAIDDCTDVASIHGADEGRDGLRKARAVGIPERHGASSSDSMVVVMHQSLSDRGEAFALRPVKSREAHRSRTHLGDGFSAKRSIRRGSPLFTALLVLAMRALRIVRIARRP